MTDIEIARKSKMLPIVEVAQKVNIPANKLEPYGHYKAKLPLSLMHDEPRENGHLILVSAISPTPAGEGKTTVSIGLNDALVRIGEKSMAVLREPSLGPVFGMKGGATGGGYSQVLPMEDINLHFTGDFAAIEKAHNLLSAMVDNNLQHQGVSLGIDPRTITWKRVLDMNDRALRKINVGMGGLGFGVPRETGFDITAASEVMAILCLSSDFEDLKRRLGNIFIGYTFAKKPIYARDLKAQGAMAVLLKDAIKPNLVQTLDGNPVILHGGPFANIAQGTNSIIATKMGLKMADYVVTEAGFGFDMGGEKFLDIKCRAGNLAPSVVVLVATIRALKYHGNKALGDLVAPDPEAVKIGLVNLEKHLLNVQSFGLVPVVAINQFATDSEAEIQAVVAGCQKLGVTAVPIEVWAKGGAGAEELAKIVVEVAESGKSQFTPSYQLTDSVETKIEAIAQKIYGASTVKYAPKALADLKKIKALKLEGLAICMAKTEKSFSDDPQLRGRPTDFIITIREIEIAAGAEFLVPITGTIMRMPGLPSHPAAELIDIDSDGIISGLF